MSGVVWRSPSGYGGPLVWECSTPSSEGDVLQGVLEGAAVETQLRGRLTFYTSRSRRTILRSSLWQTTLASQHCTGRWASSPVVTGITASKSNPSVSPGTRATIRLRHPSIHLTCYADTATMPAIHRRSASPLSRRPPHAVIGPSAEITEGSSRRQG